MPYQVYLVILSENQEDTARIYQNQLNRNQHQYVNQQPMAVVNENDTDQVQVLQERQQNDPYLNRMRQMRERQQEQIRARLNSQPGPEL